MTRPRITDSPAFALAVAALLVLGALLVARSQSTACEARGGVLVHGCAGWQCVQPVRACCEVEHRMACLPECETVSP